MARLRPQPAPEGMTRAWPPTSVISGLVIDGRHVLDQALRMGWGIAWHLFADGRGPCPIDPAEYQRLVALGRRDAEAYRAAARTWAGSLGR